ncbi:MAG: hypothetical protein BMS9Abin15_1132 [Gammaproteobacteria bacterium]|nr:MAG: hypothetical protein BMS9Abin15_1132 [Gammaproteobacteria bacterium]
MNDENTSHVIIGDDSPTIATPAIMDLPSVPLAVTEETEVLYGASVTVQLLDRSTLSGHMHEFNYPAASVRIQTHDGKLMLLPFEVLKHLVFRQSLSAASGKHPLQNHGATVYIPEAIQEFNIEYLDGSRSQLKVRHYIDDDHGLHLFQMRDDKSLVRMFIPHTSISHYEAWEPIGIELVKRGLIEQNDLESGLEKQQEIRNRKVGEYLEGKKIITPEQLRTALQNQNIAHNIKLGDILVREGLITQAQLDEVLEEQQKERGKKIGEILIDMGLITSDEISRLMSDRLGMPFVHLRDFKIDKKVIEYVPRDLTTRHKVIPLCFADDRIVMAAVDPLDSELADMLAFVAGKVIDFAIATKEDIDWAIEHYYGKPAVQGAEAAKAERPARAKKKQEPKAKAAAAKQRLSAQPMARLLKNIIVDAYKRRATDIHIFPVRENVHLSYRVDGVMLLIKKLSKTLQPGLITQLKNVGHMDTGECKLPQDGRAHIKFTDQEFDLRMSVLPTMHGESAVIRLRSAAATLAALDEIGFDADDVTKLRSALDSGYGMILTTGPKGSGTTTTLYSMLEALAQRNLKIISVEDPVEKVIDGIEQIPVDTGVGLTFARALHSILRHDPDVIMIGEIRDSETANVAVQAALAGILVLSTVRAKSAVDTINILRNMGIDPHLLQSTLLVSVAQRLMRQNCPICISEEEVSSDVRKALGAGNGTFYNGKGCAECNHTGYKGRIMTYELLAVDDNIKELIDNAASATEITKRARQAGMLSLTDRGLNIARAHKTSLDEVYKVNNS